MGPVHVILEHVDLIGVMKALMTCTHTLQCHACSVQALHYQWMCAFPVAIVCIRATTRGVFLHEVSNDNSSKAIGISVAATNHTIPQICYLCSSNNTAHPICIT